LRIVFMGSPAFAVPSLEKLASVYEIAAVYTQPDRPAGRGKQISVSPVKEAAVRLGLTVVQPESLKAESEIARLAAFKPDVIVIAAYGEILPRAVLEMPPLQCINIHPSLLPRWRGPSPVPGAILAGDPFTGVTIMTVTPKVDTGPVIAQAQIPVNAADTAGTLMERLSSISADLVLDVLVHWRRGELKPRPQDDSAATYSKMITKENGEIDWHEPVEKIWRKVRAYQPWPGAFTVWQGKRLEILQAFPLPVTGAAEPGTVVNLSLLTGNTRDAGFGVVTGDGVLGICFVKYEGKRAMPAAEFARGQRNFFGALLGRPGL
jgi:methionyl-tRNA formyltransferase